VLAQSGVLNVYNCFVVKLLCSVYVVALFNNEYFLLLKILRLLCR